MNVTSTRELKNIARDKMLGQYGTAIGAFLFMRMILMMAMGVCARVFAGRELMLTLAMFIITLFEGIFVYGELTIYLKIAVGEQPQTMDVISAFKGAADKAIKARMIIVAISFGGVYLIMFLASFGRTSQSQAMVVLCAVAELIVFAACIWLLLTYSQVIYFLQDFSGITVREACARSRKLMQGNRLTLLLMYLSFIPIYIVGVLSFMVGLYFIHPYVKMTLTEFYLDRVRSMNNTADADTLGKDGTCQ